MPQYMLLIYEDPATGPAPNTPEAQQEFAEYGEGIQTQYQCPRCGYQWSGKPK